MFKTLISNISDLRYPGDLPFFFTSSHALMIWIEVWYLIEHYGKS